MVVMRLALAAAALSATGAAPSTVESAGYSVTISAEDIRAVKAGRTIVAIAPRLQKRLAALEQAAREEAALLAQEPSDQSAAEAQAEERYAPLSLVGPYLSMDYSSSSYWPGAAHSTWSGSLETIDLRTPERPPRLDEIFPESRILAALLAGRGAKRHLPGSPPHSLEELVGTQGEADTPCAQRFGPAMLEHFAFYDVVGQNVVVQIAASLGCEETHDTLTQLRLRLPIPASLEPDLRRARSGTGGFLMKAAALRFKDIEVKLSFEKDLAPMIEALRRKPTR